MIEESLLGALMDFAIFMPWLGQVQGYSFGAGNGFFCGRGFS